MWLYVITWLYVTIYTCLIFHLLNNKILNEFLYFNYNPLQSHPFCYFKSLKLKDRWRNIFCLYFSSKSPLTYSISIPKHCFMFPVHKSPNNSLTPLQPYCFVLFFPKISFIVPTSEPSFALVFLMRLLSNQYLLADINRCLLCFHGIFWYVTKQFTIATVIYDWPFSLLWSL